MLRSGLVSRLRLWSSELDSRIARDDTGNAARDQQQGVAISAPLHEWYGLALEASDFPIGEDRLESVPDLNARAAILYGVQDENSAISAFVADTPFLEESNGIAVNVGTIERVDGDDRNLSVSLLIDLPTGVFDLFDGRSVQYMGKIVDVAGRLQLRN